ncbi:hypothetical protein GCM10010531_23460 [Blastococcus jejuensis]|uniref:Uncharacterized protein n=1 Tax=Blastococcus jejuensis TaxID=351224 RepID=A0ABP6PC65_9ACTN
MREESDGLLLRYEDRDTDGTGELRVEAKYRQFSGASSAWFSDNELLRFAEQLLTHPLGDAQLHISGGTGSDDTFEMHVGLTVALGMRGQVAVVAHLATPTNPEINPGSSRSQARVEVLTSYGGLQRFSAELRQLVAGTADEARLEAVTPAQD